MVNADETRELLEMELRPDLKTSFIEAPHLVLQARPNEAVRCMIDFLDHAGQRSLGT
jgi:hypothetical protein